MECILARKKMEGQISIEDFLQTQEHYCYVAPGGKWDKTCVNCSKWNFSFKGVRCEYPQCRENNYKDFEHMIERFRRKE